MSSKIAGFHISIISERWYQDVYQGMDLLQDCDLLFAHEKENIEINNSSSIIIPIRKSITIPKTISVVNKTVE